MQKKKLNMAIDTCGALTFLLFRKSYVLYYLLQLYYRVYRLSQSSFVFIFLDSLETQKIVN